MRVVLDYRAALREPSGVGQYAHELAAALRRVRDHAVDELALTLFSSSWKDRVRPEPALASARVVDRRVPVRLLNLAWHRLEWPPIEALVPGPVDVAHSLHPLLMPTRRAARVVTVYDVNFLTHPEQTRAEIRRDYPALARAHAQRADRVIVISKFTAGEVQRLLGVPPNRIALCPPGTPAWATPRAAPPKDAGYALFLGTLEPRKNLGVLLDAYERLARGHIRVPRLVIAGKATEHSGEWLDRIARPPLSSSVEYVGYVDASRRRALFEGARLLVQPSFEEGFGLPVLEAMATGVPVIAAGRGALPEVLGDAGLLADADSPDAFADAIRRVVDDEEIASALTARGLERARLFSWERTALATLAAYRGAILHHSGREAA